MRKFLVAALVIAVVVAQGVFAGGGKQSSYSVGFAVQDLSNPTWGGTAEELNRLITADGGEFTFMDTKNPNEQIKQIENLITKGVDAIVIHVADPASLEGVLGDARKAGIKIYSWDTDIQNSDVNWLISNYELGTVIGTQAANWINEKFGGVTEYAILNYDTEAILKERGDGIRDAIQKLAPNAKRVADQPAINAREGQAAAETILEAYPNLKVIACIGGGGAVGANNAVKGAGRLAPDFGIFAADATEEEVVAIENNEAVRMSVLISGSPKKNAGIIFGYLKQLMAGEKLDKKIMRNFIPITINNISEAR
jgi:ribose transport system substrate-binding protein